MARPTNFDVDAADSAITKLAAAIDQGSEPIEREEVDLSLAPAPPAEYRQPWDRLDGETGYQYKLFLHYRDQGAGRTARATRDYIGDHADEFSKKVKSVNLNKMYQYSKGNNWADRALAWDNDQESQYQLARSQAIRDMVDRHEDQIERAIDSLMVPIEALTHAIDSDPDFIHTLSKTDARKLISMSNQASRTIPALMSAERLARGMPTEIVGGAVDHQHTVTVERNQIGEILEILGQAGVLDVGGGNLGAGEIVDAEVVDVHPVPAEDND